MKKHPITLLSAAILSLNAVSFVPSAAAAAVPDKIQAVPISAPINEQPINAPIGSPLPEDQQPVAAFAPVTGKVKEIADFGTAGDKLVTLENKEGAIANFVVGKDSYQSGTGLVDIGVELTIFYDFRKPAIMIYPPQYQAEVIVPAAEEAVSWKVDLFDGGQESDGLLSQDKMLLILPSDKTKIIQEDGTPFTGALTGRSLAVKYGISTKSIPAQAAPDEIVVLSEEAVPPVSTPPEEGTEPGTPVSTLPEKGAVPGTPPVSTLPEKGAAPGTPLVDVAGKTIVVTGKSLQGSAAYTNNKGTVMVPLRPIAQALDLKLTWNTETRSTSISPGTSLQIGKDGYVYNSNAPVKLGTAPALVKGSTYVPLSFFTDILRMSNAYVFEDTIVIDNGEKME